MWLGWIRLYPVPDTSAAGLLLGLAKAAVRFACTRTVSVAAEASALSFTAFSAALAWAACLLACTLATCIAVSCKGLAGSG